MSIEALWMWVIILLTLARSSQETAIITTKASVRGKKRACFSLTRVIGISIDMHSASTVVAWITVISSTEYSATIASDGLIGHWWRTHISSGKMRYYAERSREVRLRRWGALMYATPRLWIIFRNLIMLGIWNIL